MKNVQVIDGAANTTYSIYALSDADFKLMFPNGRDIEFVKDFLKRVDKQTAKKLLTRLWNRAVNKKAVQGLHGTLFYELDFKKRFYPTKKESEMVTGFEKNTKSKRDAQAKRS